MSRSKAHLLWRLLLALGLLAISSACGSSGCQGCNPEPIPGGFPAQHRFNNAMQVRLSSSGIAFIEQNFKSLVEMLVAGGLSFTIPPTDCSSGSQKICCSGAACTANITIGTVDLTPTPVSTLKLNMRAQVQTSKIKYERHVAILGWFGCDVTYSSAKSQPPTLGLLADVNLVVDPASQHKLKIARGTTTLQDFDCGDIDLTGSWYCTVVDWLCPLFKGMIQDQLIGTVDSTVDGMLKSLPLGQEGRFDFASFLTAFSPRTRGKVDFTMWAGGYSEAEASGMSVGVMGGFRPATYSTCVPNCEKPGATCAAPAAPAIPRSPTFRGNLRPDGKTFDVGIGVHSKGLDHAAYAMYASGGLCLDVSTQSFAQLSSGTFSLLVPSINAFTGPNIVPMMVSVRPRQPPTVGLGKGTYHKDPSGKIVIDDPLLKITAKDFAVDVYLQLDERMVRLFTVVATLQVPALLYADANGRLQPMLGSLDQALTDVRIENGDLITEDPKSLAQSLPTIISLAAGFLASGFDPIELPSVQKLKLLLDGGSITTVDSNQVLAIFANLGIIKTTGFGGQGARPFTEERVDGQAAIEELRVPPTEAFRLGASFDPQRAPRLTLRVGADLPPGLAGQPIEWAYRVDGGFYHPWVEGERLVISDPLFWLQGEHSVEVMARVQGRPETTDPEPVPLRFVIDTVPPEVRLTPVPGGVRAEVRDLGSGAERLEYSWSVGGGSYSSFGPEREVKAPEGASVSVRVRDAAGNLASAATHASRAVTVEESGCSVGGRSPAGLAALALLLVGLLALRRRQQQRRRAR